MEKVKAKVIGQDGNVFVTLGICVKALKKASRHDEAKVLTSRALSSNSYEEAISIMSEYCELC